METIKYECTDCDNDEKCKTTIYVKDIQLYDKHNTGPITCLFAFEPSLGMCNWIKVKE